MGLEDTLGEKISDIASDNSLGALAAQSVSLSLAGGVAGGIVLYKIAEKMLKTTQKKGGERTKPAKLYGIPHDVIMVTMVACGIYVGTQIAQAMPEMYNAIFR
ncbi:MAG TPA: hypothetical protein HA282_01565 [Nanoarchaeota archaeon]|nr:hypothetical protein [Candidatus Pacearchaeota archaeon]HIH17861.1 hypothetical protein [Nanoarchaeota archaeon]HIH34807.1 hypothetical protein [Nanoarchaeota archaeon]HIH51237.1 hypothetical protein [Nanoarchaeota archaeon]HIH65886.1 hypothetical protein [Nanoarchaeota archaeon]